MSLFYHRKDKYQYWVGVLRYGAYTYPLDSFLNYRFWNSMHGNLPSWRRLCQSERESLRSCRRLHTVMQLGPFAGISLLSLWVMVSICQWILLHNWTKLSMHLMKLLFQCALSVFAVYVNTGEDHVLTPDKAFVSLSLINILNFPISLLPVGISFLGQVSRSSQSSHLQET